MIVWWYSVEKSLRSINNVIISIMILKHWWKIDRGTLDIVFCIYSASWLFSSGILTTWLVMVCTGTYRYILCYVTERYEISRFGMCWYIPFHTWYGDFPIFHTWYGEVWSGMGPNYYGYGAVWSGMEQYGGVWRGMYFPHTGTYLSSANLLPQIRAHTSTYQYIPNCFSSFSAAPGWPALKRRVCCGLITDDIKHTGYTTKPTLSRFRGPALPVESCPQHCSRLRMPS